MLALARYTLKGPYYAAGVVAVLAILSVFFPLVSGSPFLGALVAMLLTYTAGSLVGLIILTQGVQSGLKAIIVSVLVVTVVAAVVLQAPALGISIAVVQWLPVIILAQTLRVTNSLALMMLAGLLPGAIGIALQFTIWPDMEADWAAAVQQSLTQMSQGQEISQVDLSEQIRQMMHWLILMLAASLYILFVSIVMLARWMEAKLAGSEGYSKEFRNLALGKPAAMVAIMLMVLSMLLNQDWIISLTIMIAAAFLFQGIAVVHKRVLSGKFRPVLTWLFYMLLFIVPQVMVLTSIVGILDNWLLLRKRGDKTNPPEQGG